MRPEEERDEIDELAIESAVEEACEYLSQDLALPLDLTLRLMSQGICVETLEYDFERAQYNEDDQ